MCPSVTVVPPRKCGSDLRIHHGVKCLVENGVRKVPGEYVLPAEERPETTQMRSLATKASVKLPIIDVAELQGPNRLKVLECLAHACEDFGFFQLINHGIGEQVMKGMLDVSRRFFDLPHEIKSQLMSSDVRASVRYGTSFNQNKDQVLCWRDFLKLMCQPWMDVVPHWPSSPIDFRKLAGAYASETRNLFLVLVEAVVESLLSPGGDGGSAADEIENIPRDFQEGSQILVVNCYPPCPNPELTLGIPPHSDYGFLTILLQDEVEGLQIQHAGEWVTVEPIPNSFVVNVGDHLEIFSNGRYKSIIHRAIVNETKSRISVASLHSLPLTQTVRPWERLINESNPIGYKDTDFATFMEYLSTCDLKKKAFLETLKLF